METFKTVSAASKRFNEQKDCAVKAVAIVTNCPYEYVHGLYLKHGRRRRQGSYPSTTTAVLKEIGVFVERITLPGKTVKSLILPSKKRLLISTSRHLLAAVNGKIEDWTENRRHRPTIISEITW